MEPIALTIEQHFTQHQMLQTVDACTDLDALKMVSKQVIEAYMAQKAATAWALKQTLVRDNDLVLPISQHPLAEYFPSQFNFEPNDVY